MKRFNTIQSKDKKVFYVVDSLTGKCYLESENRLTAEKKASELNFINEF